MCGGGAEACGRLRVRRDLEECDSHELAASIVQRRAALEIDCIDARLQQ